MKVDISCWMKHQEPFRRRYLSGLLPSTPGYPEKVPVLPFLSRCCSVPAIYNYLALVAPMLGLGLLKYPPLSRHKWAQNKSELSNSKNVLNHDR